MIPITKYFIFYNKNSTIRESPGNEVAHSRVYSPLHYSKNNYADTEN